MMNKYIIAFKEGKILVENPGSDEKDPLYLITFLWQIGCSLSPELKGKISPELEKEILDNLIPWAINIFGLGKTWLTVYDNPEHLINKSEIETYIDQISLYAYPGIIEDIKNRDGKDDFWVRNNYKIDRILEPLDRAGFQKISYDILSSKTPLGPENKSILNWFLENKEYILLPDSIPVKETLCILMDYIDYDITSSTDILRYIAYYTEHDIKEPGKLGHLTMSGALRKRSLKYLERLIDKKKPEDLAAEMNQYKESWYAFTKVAHPNSSKISPIFDLIFGKDKSWKIKTWGNQIRRAYDENDWKKLLNLYSKRSGEFLRHFDSLLRRMEKHGLLEEFTKAFMSLDLSAKLLINLSYYYDLRDSLQKSRGYKNKQGVWISYDKELPEINPWLPEAVIYPSIKSSLTLRYKQQESLEGKKVYLGLNPKIELNLSERSSQEDSIESGLQGIKVDLPKSDLLRFFLQWIDPEGDQDLDLHAQGIIVDEKGNEKLITVGWFDRFNEKNAVLHSGDIRHQKGDCSEYITVDLSLAKKIGLKRLVINGHDYENHVLGKSCETYIGYSVVDGISKDNWTPLSSDTPFRVRLGETETQLMCLFVVDLENMWLKVITEPIQRATFTTVSDFSRNFIDKTLNLGELVKLNVEARKGELISEPEEGCIIIDKSNWREWNNILLS